MQKVPARRANSAVRCVRSRRSLRTAPPTPSGGLLHPRGSRGHPWEGKERGEARARILPHPKKGCKLQHRMIRCLLCQIGSQAQPLEPGRNARRWTRKGVPVGSLVLGFDSTIQLRSIYPEKSAGIILTNERGRIWHDATMHAVTPLFGSPLPLGGDPRRQPPPVTRSQGPWAGVGGGGERGAAPGAVGVLGCGRDNTPAMSPNGGCPSGSAFSASLSQNFLE